MDKAFKHNTRDHFFSLRQQLSIMPDAEEEALQALSRNVAVHSCAIDIPHIDPMFLQTAPEKIPDRRWDRISPDFQTAMIETQTMLQALGRLEELALAKHTLNIPFLLQLHKTAFEKTQYSAAGKFRPNRDLISATGYDLPHQSKVPEMTDHHLSWLNHRLGVFSEVTEDNFMEMFHIAAEGVYRFASTMPFETGNGRFARLVGSYALIFTGLYHYSIDYEDREEYHDAIRSSAIDNLCPLVNFTVKCFARSLDRIDGLVRLANEARQDRCRTNHS